MINYLWFILISIGVFFCIFTGNIDKINPLIFDSSKKAITLIYEMMPLMILWTGILKIAELSGLLDKVALFIKPLLLKLLPGLRNNHKAIAYISSNIAANAIGLGSAATPFGLKAMEEMQKSNNKKNEATSEMITFLVLNTSGVTIIPTTVIALRLAFGSNNPTEIIITSLLATILSTIAGLGLDYYMRRKHANNK